MVARRGKAAIDYIDGCEIGVVNAVKGYGIDGINALLKYKGDLIAIIGSFSDNADDVVGFVIKFGDEAVDAMKNGIDTGIIKRLEYFNITPKEYSVNNIISKETAELFWAKQWVNDAIHYPNSSKVLFGSSNQNGISYVNLAEDMKATYYNTDNWNDLVAQCNGNSDLLFAPNKLFIDEQWVIPNKEIVFSHDPWQALPGSMFEKEVLYLIDKGVSDFVQIEGNLWKAVR
jgi:hypothetical protein